MLGNDFTYNLKQSKPDNLEKLKPISNTKSNFTVGLPKETTFQEKRIALCPNAVKDIVAAGNKVNIEKAAGVNAGFSDLEYIESGANIVETPSDVFKSDLIIKIAPFTLKEIHILRKGQTIISSLNLYCQTKEYFAALMDKKVTAISFEHIKDKLNTYPLLGILGEISGCAVIEIAQEIIKKNKNKLLGGFSGIKPIEVLILGSGTVGENAARTALARGASVKVLENSNAKVKRMLNNVGQRVYTAPLNTDMLKLLIPQADVVIGALHSNCANLEKIVTEEMVSSMKQGSAFIDVSIVNGGCSETSRISDYNNLTYDIYGITHCCLPNIPSMYPKTSTYAMSNFFHPIIKKANIEGGIIDILVNELSIRNGIYLFNGVLVKKMIGEEFSIPSTELDLLMSAYGIKYRG